MKHLYVIGNGFDIHHGIPSTFLDYRDWLEQYKPDVFQYISEFFDNLCFREEWSSFEKNLGEKDIREYATYIARQNYPDISRDDFRDRDYHSSELAAKIETSNVCNLVISTFSDWIDSLPEGKMEKNKTL
jgi:hypothetical protein